MSCLDEIHVLQIYGFKLWQRQAALWNHETLGFSVERDSLHFSQHHQHHLSLIPSGNKEKKHNSRPLLWSPSQTVSPLQRHGCNHHMLPPRLWVANEQQQNHHQEATAHPLPARKRLLFSGRTWPRLFWLRTGGTAWLTFHPKPLQTW